MGIKLCYFSFFVFLSSLEFIEPLVVWHVGLIAKI
jgi:hypothetical protein